ncbi:MAG: response regulator, partial [Solirubrobacterales bacterium]|nr:response regulator [Solirubrobacterales bacterium]MBV9472717.1 response regulator [Solirubrobacterales bacterium]
MIRVLIVDDNPVIRRGIAALLGEAEDIRLAGEAGDGQEAVRLASELHPDVVLLDVRMPVMDGIAAAGPLSEKARVMMLTYTDEEEQVVAAIRAGASGYLVHGQFDADELVARIRQLAAGETVLSPAVVGT